jgi:transcription elongation factor GreA
MIEHEYLTPEGLHKFERELEHLKTVRRAEVAQRLHDAMAEGEVEENPEFEDAKNEQAFVEGRIMTIETILANAILIEHNVKAPANEIRLGSKVTITEVGTKDQEHYILVGTAEADPMNGKISNESPLGRSLIGHKLNDTIDVQTPDGTIKFKISKVNNR